MALPFLHRLQNLGAQVPRQTGKCSRRVVSRGPGAVRPHLEVLEDRLAPATADPASSVVPQLPLPTKTGQTFVVDDWDNKVTQTDLGFNYFAGNTGATETVKGTTTLDVSPLSNRSTGGSLSVAINFAGQAPEVYAGYFASLFGLTDTLVSLDGSGVQPTQTTPFPGYYLDTQDIYRGFGPLAGRSIEQLRFDVRLESSQAVTLKIELKDENQFDVFTRRTLTNPGAWQTLTLSLPGDFTNSVKGQGNPSAFNWRQVSTLALIVERHNVADAIANPDTAQFLVDNLVLVDTNGSYPDLNQARNPVDGTLDPRYANAFLDLVRWTSAEYFIDFASTDPRTGGIVQDRSTFADLMSVGGVGFQLNSYVVDARQGYLPRTEVATRVLNILRVLHDHPQGPDRVGTIGYQGFFYHFLGIDGLRKQNFDFTATAIDESLNTVELSPIDTALAVAGVITAAQYFDGSNATETEIRTLANDIYGRVNWNFMLDPTTHQFYLGWKPNERRDDDSGTFGRFKLNDDLHLGQYSSKLANGQEVPATLDYYTDEALLIALLAMGSPNPAHRLSREVWDAIIRDPEGGSFIKTYPGSLFTYQFFSVWNDTQLLGTDNYPGQPVDFFTNTRNAILATQDYASANPLGHATLSANQWGLSATEGPFDDYFAEAAPPAAIHPGGQEPSGGPVTGPGGPIGLEGEAGTGDGLPMFRGNASGGQTVLLDAGQTRTLTFDLAGTTSYEFAARYSNDGPSDLVQVDLDGQLVGQFLTQDTRPPNGGPGDGWNVFFSSGPLNSLIVGPGHHQVTVTVVSADPNGVEIDDVTLTPKPVPRPLEQGTVTNYAVGSSIVHTPTKAIAALWDSAENEDLNQDSVAELFNPRFGFADAYNRNIADVLSDSTATRKRSTGAWMDDTGFAIDQGPMLLLIDNFLEGQVVPHLFMSYPTVNSALKTLFPSLPPILTSLAPSSLPALSVPAQQSLPLAVSGAGFQSSDVVEISFPSDPATFHPQPTSFRDSTVLIASVSGSQLATAGTLQVRVRQTVGSGISNSLNFTVTSADPGGDLEFGTSSYEVAENKGQATITVLRTGPTNKAVTVKYATTTGGTATAKVNYTPTSGTLSFAAGQASKTFSVPIKDDTRYDTDQTVSLMLSNPTGGAGLGFPTAATLVIHNSDPRPTVAFKQSTASGPESQNANLTVTLSAASALTTMVSYAVTGGTAMAGTDFTLPVVPTLTFNPGQTTAVLPITIINDGLVHPNRTLTLTLLAMPVNAALGKTTTATYTIIDNNPLPTVSFKQASGSGPEPASASLPVILSAKSAFPVTINYAVTGGTATAGVDFKLPPGTLTFQAGQTTRNLVIPILDDHLYGNNKTIQVTLAAPSNALLGTTTMFTYTIVERQKPPTVNFKQASGSGPITQNANLVVVLSSVSALTTTVNFAVTGGTAMAGTDYTLPANPTVTFNPGQTMAVIPITILNDGTRHANRTLRVTLSGPVNNATLGTNVVETFTIIDNNMPSTMASPPFLSRGQPAGGSFFID